MKRILLLLAILAIGVSAQTIPGAPAYQLPPTVVPNKWFGTAAPTSALNYPSQPGDLFFDTTGHNVYVCAAPVTSYIPLTGGAPACTSVATGQWTLVGTVGSSGTLVTPTLELPLVADTTDPTKTVQFSLSGATTGTKTTVTAAQTANRVVTLPDASITIPGTVVNNCGTANACSATNVSATSKVVVGVSAALNGASPSIATITGMPAFTSSSTYVCTANVNSASASTHVLAINYVSSSSVTFTGANGATDTVSYLCIGN